MLLLLLLLLLVVVVVEMVVVGIVVVVAFDDDGDVKMLYPAFIVKKLSAGTAARAALHCSSSLQLYTAALHCSSTLQHAPCLTLRPFSWAPVRRSAQAAHFHPRHSIEHLNPPPHSQFP